MGFEILLTILFVSLLANFISLDITVSQMKKDRLKLDVVTAITALEMATKKLNEKLKCETQSLSDYKQRLKRLKKRIDILEEGHPDSDIDFEVDDDANVIAVWFNGKKYVPEDKRDEDTVTFYADSRVVAETTRQDPPPESKYKCSDCVRFRRERIDGKWCGICSVDNVIMSDGEQYICDKFRVYQPIGYYVNENIGGNDKTEQLLKCAERLDYIYSTGLISIATYWNMMEELMQNDT